MIDGFYYSSPGSSLWIRMQAGLQNRKAKKQEILLYQAKKGGDRRERDNRKWEEGTENDGRMAKKTIPVGYSVQSAIYCRASEVHEESTSIKPSSSGVCWWDAPGFSP